ncbi:MAG: hypothetical protein L3J04_04265 [Robiginitomaculum sp.]|nr:hypothetical protein [Robiginitomaculum sp.]
MSETNIPKPKSAFPFSDCVFHGFQIPKGKLLPIIWNIVLPVIVLSGLYYVGITYGFVQVFADIDFIAMEDLPASEMSGFLVKSFVLYGLVIVASFVFMATTMNAAYRWFLHQDLKGTIGALRFGMDEVRTALVLFVYSLMVFVVPYILLIVFMIIGGVIIAAVGNMVGTIIGGLIMAIGGLAMLPLMVWLAVKLSLSVPMSLDAKKFTMFKSMALTKGRGWALLGSYSIMGVIYFVAISIVSVLQNVVLLGQMMPMLSDPSYLESGGTEMFAAMAEIFKSPEMLLAMAGVMVLQIIVSTVFLFGYTGLTAFSMRYLQEEKGELLSELDVFD